MASSKLLQYHYIVSLGHVETKPSPSQDYENMGELSSSDQGEGRVGQDRANTLLRASLARGWRRGAVQCSADPGLPILLLLTFPRQPGQ